MSYLVRPVGPYTAAITLAEIVYLLKVENKLHKVGRCAFCAQSSLHNLKKDVAIKYAVVVFLKDLV